MDQAAPLLSGRYTVTPKALVQTHVAPVRRQMLPDGTAFVDFGRAAFGTLLIPPTTGHNRTIVVHLGEKLTDDGRIDRQPPGFIRYRRIEQPLSDTSSPQRIVIAPDQRNTGPAAIKMPASIGEVLPFRYAEIERAGNVDLTAVRQISVHYPFDDNAAAFTCSNDTLNAVWDLCKYSIKATTFCGIYIDGDRERIPYEGDAYINQLCHYGVDREYDLARYSLEYLIQYPTWPTEWQMHTVFMAWQDYLYTGYNGTIEAFYDDLVTKTLIDLAGSDALVSTRTTLCSLAFQRRLHLFHEHYIANRGLTDIVDWPPGSFATDGIGERDNHQMMPVNTVVNAFHYRALVLMARMASAIGRNADAQRFTQQAARVKNSVNRQLFDPQRGIYIDGRGSTHASLHSNMFALAFGLVPADRHTSVLDYVQSRGMACSVYGSQYLLDALYRHGRDTAALNLMTATHDRSWWNMLSAGSSITLEAWNLKYKNNMDWNHPWGAAPANIIPRRLMGIRPAAPGSEKILIQPRPGTLTRAAITTPMPTGTVQAQFTQQPGQSFTLELTVPDGVTACIDLPRCGIANPTVTLDDHAPECTANDTAVRIDAVPAGRHVLTIT